MPYIWRYTVVCVFVIRWDVGREGGEGSVILFVNELLKRQGGREREGGMEVNNTIRH